MANRDDYIIQKIVQYCSEIAKAHEVFENNKNLFVHPEDGAVYRNSVTMPLLQIGELAKLLSNDFMSAHSNIPWKNIIRLRDFLAHHYIKVDYDEIWETSHQDVDLLKSSLIHAEP